jgi:hypothetical protein
VFTYGMLVTSGMLAIAILAPAVVIALVTARKSASKSAAGVSVTPSMAMPEVAAARASLLPIHRVTKVGWSDSPCWSWVKPSLRRIRSVGSLALVDAVLVSRSCRRAPGTAMLL